MNLKCGELTETNSSLSTERDCPRRYDLGYNHQLELDGDEPEYFGVGNAWHAGMEHKMSPSRFDVIRATAPSSVWGEKLARLAAAYDWYWESQPLDIVQTEFTFEVELDETVLRGQIDGVVVMPDGRRGIIEYKTTGDNLGGDYFDKLRLDTQVGLYALAAGALGLFEMERPDFIYYDVVRKPTINPKRIAKKEIDRMSDEIKTFGTAGYFGGTLTPDELDEAVQSQRETDRMYGARLSADIGNDPDKYFARREVHRTDQDYSALIKDLRAQLDMIEFRRQRSAQYYPRNPDACAARGRAKCQFAGLCWNNRYPARGEVPEGFRVRKHRHVELDGKPRASAS